MKVAITIPTFRRRDALDQCLQSLGENDGVPSILTYEDGFGSKRLYGCRNIIRSLREAFKVGYDRVIRMDSDLKVSPYFVKQVLALKDWSGMPSQTQIHCPHDVAFKTSHAREVVHGCQTGCNLALDRHEWEKIQPVVDEYENAFLATGLIKRDHVAPRQWFKDRVNMIPHNVWFRNAYVTGDAGIGADSLIFFALLANGMNVACLVVNRAIHISEYGENYAYDPNSYRMLNSNSLDVLESDATETDFKWID